MSFKREGDDTGLLGNLRRRRIKELLAEDVPEDEAKLLSNGRFACLVCVHKPIFDTVSMLTVHRKGKKHAASEAIFLQKKKELRQLILKRQHEQFLKDGTTNIKVAVSFSPRGIGTAQPYDPCVKKHKMKPYERKLCLELSEPQLDIGLSSAAQITTGLPAATPVCHSHQLKNISKLNNSLQESLTVQPYYSKRSGHSSSEASEPGSLPSSHSALATFTSNSIETGTCLAKATPSTSLSSKGHKPVCDGVAHPYLDHRMCLAANSAHHGGSSVNCDAAVNIGPVINNCQGAVGDCGSIDVTTLNSSASQAVNAARSMASTESAEVSMEKRKRAQQYLHLRGAGWKKDWDGKWIRDEDAEFDSDEEPPALP